MWVCDTLLRWLLADLGNLNTRDNRDVVSVPHRVLEESFEPYLGV